MNCFPTDGDQPEEETKDQTLDAQTKESEPAQIPAGTSKKEGENGETKPLTKLDRKRVDAVWDEVRGTVSDQVKILSRKLLRKTTLMAVVSLKSQNVNDYVNPFSYGRRKMEMFLNPGSKYFNF